MNKSPLFKLGNVVATPGAMDVFYEMRIMPSTLLHRHAYGDWGNLDSEDKAANDFAVSNGLRILSAYVLTDKIKIWIITEADRSSTTLLLPSEY